jgi:hypothetical protein
MIDDEKGDASSDTFELLASIGRTGKAEAMPDSLEAVSATECPVGNGKISRMLQVNQNYPPHLRSYTPSKESMLTRLRARTVFRTWF